MNEAELKLGMYTKNEVTDVWFVRGVQGIRAIQSVQNIQDINIVHVALHLLDEGKK